MYNQGSFKGEQYGDDRIEKTATLFSTYSGTETAKWTQGYIKKYEIIDEVQILQLGQLESEEYEKIEYYDAIPSVY